MNVDETPHLNDYFVSPDRRLLDSGFVIREITTSYWGSWRSPAVVLRSLDHSLCFGLYWRRPFKDRIVDEQVGFARVVTDYTTFAWICDVLITKAHRGKGLGKFLMGTVMAHAEVKARACLLSTHDATDFYARFGFEKFVAMKRLPSQTGE